MKHSLRHFLATIYYRGNKYLENYNNDFPTFHSNDDTRTPVQILNHINGLLMYSRSFLEEVINTYPPTTSFDEEITRFRKEIQKLDNAIISSEINNYKIYDQILQGPLADIMLHIGVLSMVRRIMGNPADDYENYMNAPIEEGLFEY